ncbi:MbtH family protein [Lentzea sp. PSKA42]|uniref:MbtH family protein n=1 Tax=Lentzea indica TaxID=2604800 RepID=A0ABX1FIJ6_9PSEU|nr:MbtH family NRPS accessory protein [Lentzea indica]NKE58809.1 MbtH family protein [Lentzea indica]
MTGDPGVFLLAVLVDEEGRYGLHPADAVPPDGWSPTGFHGTEDSCIRFVDDSQAGQRPGTR